MLIVDDKDHTPVFKADRLGHIFRMDIDSVRNAAVRLFGPDFHVPAPSEEHTAAVCRNPKCKYQRSSQGESQKTFLFHVYNPFRGACCFLRKGLIRFRDKFLIDLTKRF